MYRKTNTYRSPQSAVPSPIFTKYKLTKVIQNFVRNFSQAVLHLLLFIRSLNSLKVPLFVKGGSGIRVHRAHSIPLNLILTEEDISFTTKIQFYENNHSHH